MADISSTVPAIAKMATDANPRILYGKDLLLYGTDHRQARCGGEIKLDLIQYINPGPVGQVRDKWLCLGVLCLKIQIPSTKFQYSMTKTFQGKTLFGYLNFGHWDLFDIWSLIFGISTRQRNFSKANPLWS